MDRSIQTKKRLIDIKKQLGLARDEAYTVYTYPVKSSSISPIHVSDAKVIPRPSKPKRNIARTRSAFIPSAVAMSVESNRPVPSPKPRRTPPKPPPPYNPTVNSSNETSPPPLSADGVKKLPPKPKPRTFPSSKSQTFERSSSSSPLPKLKMSSCSSEENLLNEMDSRPRLSTPTKIEELNTDSSNIQSNSSEPSKGGQSLVVDHNGMATVTSNYRPSGYCMVDLDNEGGGSLIIDDSTNNSCHGNDNHSSLPSTTDTNTTAGNYDTTSHAHFGSHAPLDQRYSSFDRPNKPPNLHNRLPEYDEIDIDNRRPVIVTRTTGYSTLGGSSTSGNDRVNGNDRGLPVLSPKSTSAPKSPKPPPPRRPPILPPVGKKSIGSSREQSPSSPKLSPVPKRSLPLLPPPNKQNGTRNDDTQSSTGNDTQNATQNEIQNEAQDTNNPNNGCIIRCSNTNSDSQSNKQDVFCEIDINAILARAKEDNLPLPDDLKEEEEEDSKELIDNRTQEETSRNSDEVKFEESMVKFAEVIDESLLPQRSTGKPLVSHMYESLPWDSATNDASSNSVTKQPPPVQQVLKSVRRKPPPPPPPGTVRSGSPTLPRREKPEDLTKSLTLGRQPRNMIVTPTNSFDGEIKASPTQPPPSNTRHNVTTNDSSTPSKNRSFLKPWKRTSKDESGGLRGSKKRKKKTTHVLNSSHSVDSKSSTLPARPRGRSLDPNMAYSTMNNLEDTQNRRDYRSPSPLPDAFAYSIVEARNVPLRSNPEGIRTKNAFRRSQSVEHIYEFGRSLDSISSASRGKSPSSFDDSSIGSANQCHLFEGLREDSPIDNDRVSLSPIRDVSHISTGDGQLYAIVTKQPRSNQDGTGNPKVPHSSAESPESPPPLPPFRVASKNPPPKPVPYKVFNETTSERDNRDLFPRGNGNQPSHSYDVVDFTSPTGLGLVKQNSVDKETPSISVRQPSGKIRALKPKDKPAPLPPQASLELSSSNKPISPSMKKQNSVGDYSEGQSRLSTSTSDGTISTTGYYDSDSSEFEPPSSDEDEDDEKINQPQVRKSKTYYIAEEILTTERTFVRGLTLLHHDFRSHMLSSNDKMVVTEDVLNQILSSNLGGIHQLNSELLDELEERLKNWDSKPKLGDIFVRRAPFLKLYSPYISNFDKALKALEEQTKKNQSFAQSLKVFEVQPKCNNLTVAAYLLETVQRIPRYKLLLADYIKHLPADSDDREDSEKAYEIIASVASHVNDTIKQIENFRKIIEVSKRLIGDVGDSLISPHRKLLKEGELIKSSRKEKQPRMFFLFTDLLVYASAIPPANTTFRVIKTIPLDGMKVQELDDPEMKYAFQIISTCKSFRLEANTIENRDGWIKAFEGAIRDHFDRIQSRQLHRRSILNTDMTDGVNNGESTLGMFAPPWLPDSSVSMCQLCCIHFTVTRRRHHCRACGMIFCGDCSSYVAPLPYKNNKPCRVCQTCCTTLTDREDCITPDQTTSTVSKTSTLKGKPKRLSNKKISMPSVLREVRARDDSAHISGYLFHRKDKSRQWKKKWFVVYNLVMYEFKRHEDVTAKQSIPLPSYTVSRVVQGLNDPLVFSLEHSGAGRIVFRADNEELLERWVNVLEKAVKGEMVETSSSP